MNGKDVSDTSRTTNWAELEALDDEGIDYSDIPPLTEEFFEKATLRIPAAQARQLVETEPEVLKWFQAQGGEYKAFINAILRHYLESREHDRSSHSTSPF